MKKSDEQRLRLLVRFFIATLVSIPLVTILVLPPGTLNEYITVNDMSLAAPFVIEFMSFYFLYAFVKNKSKMSEKERKLLIVLVSGIFILFSIPVIIAQIVNPIPGIPQYSIFTLLLYAYVSLILNTRAISESSEVVEKYFMGRYITPGLTSLIVMFIVAISTSVELNAVVLYLVIKNYIFVFSGKTSR